MSHRADSAVVRSGRLPSLRSSSPRAATGVTWRPTQTRAWGSPPRIAARSGQVERLAPSVLAGLLEEPGVRVIDVRRELSGFPSPYSVGHIPGASWFDVDSALDGSRRRPRSLLEFAAVMARQGVGDEHLVVLYDEGKYGSATALAQAMVEFGHRTVAVLSGGWQGWVSAEYPAERTPRVYPPASYTARQGAGR